jgi:hypothetical protein
LSAPSPGAPAGWAGGLSPRGGGTPLPTLAQLAAQLRPGAA